MVRHRAIDIARRNGRHAARRASEDRLERRRAPDDVGEEAITRDANDRLWASLALLPDAQRQVIALAFYGQLSHSQISNQLDLPAGTVKSRMRLGLQKLRADIEAAA